jgi:uncharacterized protein (DUF2252 family)
MATVRQGEARLRDVVGTIAEREASGRAARKDVPRSSHAGAVVAPDRRDPVEVLEEQAATRLTELIPIRYGRMASSPFAFFRGAAAVMAMDLAATPRSGIITQLCGDAHLANFGIYNAPDRRLIFDLNDFDETLPGPWEWDVKRLVASLVIAADSNGLDRDTTHRVARETVRAYREAMAGFSGMSNLRVWYARLEIDQLLESMKSRTTASVARRQRRTAEKLALRDNLQAYSKLTEVVDGRPRFRSAPPLVVPISQLFGQLGEEWIAKDARRILEDYRVTLEDDRRHLIGQYSYVDLARKVVGVGSVGTRAWVALMIGRDDDDPLLLQWKEAQASVLERYVGPSTFDRPGHRVVAGQRMMQAASDIFLGWYRGIGMDGVERDFYVRQLRDGKGSVDVATLDAEGLTVYGGICAWTLARAHARAGDPVAIAAYLGSGRQFDDAIATYAEAYADQNEKDHQALLDAISSGRITALTGV